MSTDSEGDLRHRDQIINWILANPGSHLAQCAARFNLEFQELYKLVYRDGPFRDALIARHSLQRDPEISNPSCPRCGGTSAEIAYGFPPSLGEEQLGYTLDVLAGYATWSHGCMEGSDGKWECNACGHKWGE